jgi:hypothetical protein
MPTRTHINDVATFPKSSWDERALKMDERTRNSATQAMPLLCKRKARHKAPHPRRLGAPHSLG